MLEEHEAVMREADESGLTREGLRAALRDDPGSKELGELMPERILRGVDELRRMAEVPGTPEELEPPPRVEAPVIVEGPPVPRESPEAGLSP